MRYNGAPSQDFWIIRRHPKTGAYQRDRMTWGLIPYWVKDRAGGRKPINAKAETITSLPSFRDAYQRRHCLLPVDNFFEWRAIKGAKAKQPYAIAMKSGEPFALAAIWENWKAPGSEEWLWTFAIITTDANELARPIHDRMPVIVPPEAYERWLANIEPDPRDLLVPYPSEPMRLWLISTRVNKPEKFIAPVTLSLRWAVRFTTRAAQDFLLPGVFLPSPRSIGHVFGPARAPACNRADQKAPVDCECRWR